MISDRKYFILMNLLLLAGMVYYGVEIYSKLTAAESKPARTMQEALARHPLANQPPNNTLRHYRPITARDLFNTAAKEKSAGTSVNIAALEPTQLNLKLWGTVADEDGRSAYAVIEDVKTRRQGLYRAGDPVDNASVKLVLREKIVLRVYGKDEILTMADPASSRSTAPVRVNRSPATAGPVVLSRSVVEAVTRDPDSLANQARFEPYPNNKRPAGIRLAGIKPGSLFAKFGLRNGDILLRAGRVRVRSADDLPALAKSLETAATVKIQIRRRSRLKTITCKIE